MPILYDAEGNEVNVPDAALTGGQEADDKAELARVRSENARQAEAIKRLAAKPGMGDEELPAISTLAAEAAKAERANNAPQDEVLGAYIGKIAEETMKRGAAKREAAKVAENFNKLLADVEAMKEQIQS